MKETIKTKGQRVKKLYLRVIALIVIHTFILSSFLSASPIRIEKNLRARAPDNTTLGQAIKK